MEYSNLFSHLGDGITDPAPSENIDATCKTIGELTENLTSKHLLELAIFLHLTSPTKKPRDTILNNMLILHKQTCPDP